MQAAIARLQLSPGARVFRGSNARGALEAVKAALGSDAVILETREVPGGWFRTGEIEIVAAPGVSELSGPDVVEQRQSEASLSELIDDRLLDLGIERSVARVLTRQTLSGGARDVASAVAAARTIVATKLQAAPTPWGRDRRRVIALVGPTGVGKTTTIAKIAARALFESSLKVALVTVDTNRVGAAEQLSKFGDIMRVPTYIARDSTQLTRALDQASDADLVLIDTAGRFAETEVMNQARMLRAIPGLEMLLTLSLTASARDLDATADKYRFLNPARIILTKLDEARAPGAFLSAAIRLPRPVACVTNGQCVPEDIHPATVTQLVELVMGGGFQPPPDRRERRAA